MTKNIVDEITVFKQPLAIHSTRPMTGFMRTGYCEAPRADAGNHSVAGTYPPPYILLPPTHIHSNRNIRVPRLLRRARKRPAPSRNHGWLQMVLVRESLERSFSSQDGHG
jgi:hypothetical protein